VGLGINSRQEKANKAMNSILVKISLFFFAMIAATLIAFWLIGYLVIPTSARRNDIYGRTYAMQLGEARLAYETGGPKALGAFFERLRKIFPSERILIDSSNRDLVNGQDRSDLVTKFKRGPKGPPLPFFENRGVRIIYFPSTDGKYSILAITHPVPDNTTVLPYGLCVLAAVGIICIAMALYIASPLRRLRHIVDQFGNGELSARADISRKDEFGSLSRAFNLMADRIQTLLTAERRLLQDISHELRSPLARLEFAVELARSSENRNASLDRIKRDLDRLGTLIGELFQVTRAEGDPGSRKNDDVELDSLVHLLVEDCALEAEVRHCRVLIHADAPVMIQGDAELLRRALENMLRNAIRHSPEGSAIEVGLKRQNGTAVLSVRDYGTGVPEETLQDIFKPFFRVDSDRNRASGGVGLGLAIAQRAVLLHHGRVEAQNMYPGLMMTMELPVTQS
jgi:signal transduction histidine kinase